MAIGALCFFGGASLGQHLSFWLFGRYVPARCSQCRGPMYLQSEDAKEVRYRCRSCGHEYVGASWQE
jgi:hypothetical protein